MTTVVLAANGFGGLIQGAFGTYNVATDGNVTVDTRDAPPLIARGFSYVKLMSAGYTLPLAPLGASVGAIVASGSLSNGSVSVTAQPDTARPVNFEWGTGTTAITAGTATVTYVGNDGVSGSDVFNLATALSTANTQALSRGCVTISSIVIAGLAGGTSPWRRMSRTASVSVPVSPNASDVTFNTEVDDLATIALGTPSTTVLASIAPTTAPNGTHTYSFNYTFTSPVT